MAEHWMQRAPWQPSSQLMLRAGTCAKCAEPSRWGLVSNDDIFAFCGPCTCLWSHPDSELVDETDPYQSCPECSFQRAVA